MKNAIWAIGIVIVIMLFLFLVIHSHRLKHNHSNHSIEPFILVNDDNMYMPVKKLPPTEIKYQIPIAQNQLTSDQLQSLDTDILRNVRVNKVFSNVDELDFYQIYNIIKPFNGIQLKFTYIKPKLGEEGKLLENEKAIELNSGAINNPNLDLDLFSRIKLELVSAFNHTIIKSGYYLPYHKYQFFKIINSNLISFTPQSSQSSKSNWVFTITIAREFKFQQFVLYYDIDLSSNGKYNYTAKINKIEIIGMPIPKTIEFHENRKTEVGKELDLLKTINSAMEADKDSYRQNSIFQGQVSDSQSFDVQPSGDNSQIFQSPNTKFINITETNPDIDRTMFNNNSQNAFVEQRIMNIARDQQFRNHKCFGLVDGISKEMVAYNDNPLFCTS